MAISDRTRFSCRKIARLRSSMAAALFGTHQAWRPVVLIVILRPVSGVFLLLRSDRRGLNRDEITRLAKSSSRCAIVLSRCFDIIPCILQRVKWCANSTAPSNVLRCIFAPVCCGSCIESRAFFIGQAVAGRLLCRRRLRVARTARRQPRRRYATLILAFCCCCLVSVIASSSVQA